MELPTPHGAVTAFASFVRERLAEVGDSLGPLLARLGDGDKVSAESEQTRRAARQLAAVVVAAAAPFAPTSYARARLLRQLHASGLLTDQEAAQTGELLGVAQ